MRRLLAAACLLAALAPPAWAPAAWGHDIERAETLLAEIAAHRRAAADGPTESERAEAIFRLGETTETLVAAINRDVAAHGRDMVGELLVRRLRAHGLEVAWASRSGRYEYDLAVFAEYLRMAPRGRWVGEAKFQLIARRFHATLGPDPATLVGTDVATLLGALAEEERFLAEHAAHERAGTVRFFVAVDHYRIARNTRDPARAREHERRARQALQQTVERSTEVFEVRAAQTLLETLAR